jgi:two-component system chemotaxis response regulator CheB
MLSALTGEGAQATLEALELGAVDFFLKPSVVHPAGHDQSSGDLIVKVKQASRTKIAAKRAKAQASESTPEKSSCSESDDFEINRVLAIGSSTGGPKALMQVIPYLPADFPAAVLIVQHMPPVFTKAMAERLDKASKLEVREAVEGDRARHRLVLIAPGNYHMTLDRNGKIRLNQDPPRWGVRPSVDTMMESVAKYYGEVTLGVVLTGMGVDGTLGAAAIKGRGGTIFAQDEQTSAVYGMPMSVAKEGYADKILPLQKMADEIVKYCRSEVKVHA